MSDPAARAHEECLERISASLDGPLAPRDAALLDSHLQGCPDCARARQQLMAASAALRATPRETIPVALRAAVLSQSREASRTGGAARAYLSRWALAPVLAALLISVAWLLSPPGERMSYEDSPPAAPPAAVMQEARREAQPVPAPPVAKRPAPARQSSRDVASGRVATPPGDVRPGEPALLPGPQVASARPIDSRFRTTLQLGPQGIELGPLIPAGPGGAAAGEPRALTPQEDRVDRDAESKMAAESSAAPSAASAPSRGIASAPSKDAAASPAYTILFLLRVDAAGRIEEAQTVGAQTAPYGLTQDLIRWLVGRSIQPHGAEEPSSIALEIQVPAGAGPTP